MARQNAIPIDQMAFLGARRTKVSIDFTLAAWNTVAAHRVFTVAGLVRMTIIYYVTSSLTSSGAATVAFGYTTSASGYAAAQAYTGLTTGLFAVPQSTAAGVTGWWANIMNSAKNGDMLFSGAGGYNSGLTIAAAALTGGGIDAYAFWTPITDDGNVTAGTGGAL